MDQRRGTLIERYDGRRVRDRKVLTESANDAAIVKRSGHLILSKRFHVKKRWRVLHTSERCDLFRGSPHRSERGVMDH